MYLPGLIFILQAPMTHSTRRADRSFVDVIWGIPFNRTIYAEIINPIEVNMKTHVRAVVAYVAGRIVTRLT